MRLFLLRHADALYTMPDPSRELSEKGRKSLRKLTIALKPRHFTELYEIWHSPYTRAFETAQLFKDGLELNAPLTPRDFLTPMEDPRKLAGELASLDVDILAVGHNPHMENTARLLLGGGMQMEFKKAGLMCLERLAKPEAETPFGTWQLSWFLVPKLL